MRHTSTPKTELNEKQNLMKTFYALDDQVYLYHLIIVNMHDFYGSSINPDNDNIKCRKKQIKCSKKQIINIGIFQRISQSTTKDINTNATRLIPPLPVLLSDLHN